MIHGICAVATAILTKCVLVLALVTSVAAVIAF
jgi:hypothetical protein